MHTIAFASLVFLPISTVAVRSNSSHFLHSDIRNNPVTALSSSNEAQTIFGTQFFNYDPSDSGHEIFQVASTFRYFWLIVIPLTALILSVWSYFHRHSLFIWLNLGRFRVTGYSGRVRRSQGLQPLGP